MEYLHHQFDLAESDIVEVTLAGNAANDLLLDDDNFPNYQQGKSFNYQGGYARTSPAIAGATPSTTVRARGCSLRKSQAVNAKTRRKVKKAKQSGAHTSVHRLLENYRQQRLADTTQT
ncbi:MAG: DUF1883 domain-containing protein [Gemmataceae bacterium]